MATTSEFDRWMLWQCAPRVPNLDPAMWRYDGNLVIVKWTDYDNRESQHGWHVDHIKPLAEGGSDSIFNKRILNVYDNLSHGGRLAHRLARRRTFPY